MSFIKMTESFILSNKGLVHPTSFTNIFSLLKIYSVSEMTNFEKQSFDVSSSEKLTDVSFPGPVITEVVIVT